MEEYSITKLYRLVSYTLNVTRFRRDDSSRYMCSISVDCTRVNFEPETHTLGESYEILELIQKFEAKFKQLVDNYVSSFDTIMTQNGFKRILNK